MQQLQRQKTSDSAGATPLQRTPACSRNDTDESYDASSSASPKSVTPQLPTQLSPLQPAQHSAHHPTLVHGEIGDFAVAFFDLTGESARCEEFVMNQVAFAMLTKPRGGSGSAAASGGTTVANSAAHEAGSASMAPLPHGWGLLWRRMRVGQSRTLLNMSLSAYHGHTVRGSALPP